MDKRLSRDIKLLCEKPITRKQVDDYIKNHHWKQSRCTWDCVLASLQFKNQAKALKHYNDPKLLEIMIRDVRNANAYLWTALEVSKYEAKYGVKFYEQASWIMANAKDNSIGKLVMNLAEDAASLNYDLNSWHVPPLPFTSYGLKLLN